MLRHVPEYTTGVPEMAWGLRKISTDQQIFAHWSGSATGISGYTTDTRNSTRPPAESTRTFPEGSLLVESTGYYLPKSEVFFNQVRKDKVWQIVAGFLRNCQPPHKPEVVAVCLFKLLLSNYPNTFCLVS